MIRRSRFFLEPFGQLPQQLLLVHREIVFFVLTVNIEKIKPFGRAAHMQKIRQFMLRLRLFFGAFLTPFLVRLHRVAPEFKSQ